MFILIGLKNIYASVAQANAILQMRGTPSIWDVITEQVIAMNGRSYSEVVAMVSDILSRAGISSVGGCSAALLSQASAVVIGAVGTHLAATLLIASYVNLLTTSEIAYAVNSSKNFLNISYLTSYHGGVVSEFVKRCRMDRRQDICSVRYLWNRHLLS